MPVEKKFGCSVLRFDRVSSTNDIAKELAASGASEGLCVIAAEQTAGRGRQGRSWSSPAGEGLYMSVVLRPTIKPSDAGIITLLSAVAVAETLRLDYQIEADIKWPNDIMIGGRKVSGILIESVIEDGRLDYVVLGVGVNTGQRSFPDEVASSATSLWIETRQTISPEEFSDVLLRRLEQWYFAAQSDSPGIVSRWEELSPSSRNCSVRVETSGDEIEGITQGLTGSGALVVELASGELREIVAGDVRVRSFTA
jgi:BirA family transcriptional regulator, biotin operon repressor / biotin---[acetyl-CoA-carboxylase] ligase